MNLNHEVVCDFVEKNSKILDLGCADGTLLKLLKEKKHVRGLGVEIDQDKVLQSLEKGLSIVQGDLDKGLNEFPDNSYDYAILSQTLQSTKNPEFIIYEMLRVARKCIVSFPNFAYWKVRFYLFFKGRMPISKRLPYEWHDTPNIHLLTINDFYDFCKIRNIKIEKAVYLTKSKLRGGYILKNIANFFSQEAVFMITK